MDKRALRAIPIAEADDLVIRVARQACSECRYVVAATVNEGMLSMTFFDVTAARCGVSRPMMRTFHTHDDYITQDLTSEKTHWRTSSFSMMDATIKPYEYYWKPSVKSDFRSDEDLETVLKFFRKYAYPQDDSAFNDVWYMIERCQDEIKERRLMERHTRELEETDALMSTVSDPPQEFLDWVWDTGMEFSQYLIYKETRRGVAECKCMVCRQSGEVKRSEVRLRNNERGACPFCGAKVTFKAKGRMPRVIQDNRYFDLVTPTRDGFIFRVFDTWRYTYRADGQLPENVVEDIHEVRRAFYTFHSSAEFLLDFEPDCEEYEWGVYKQRGNLRWCPGSKNQPCFNNVLYPGNLPDAWAHTQMEYSALEILSENRPEMPCRYEDAIWIYCDYPKLEWLIKMGLYRLTKDVVSWYRDCVDLNRGTIYEILELGKVNTRVLQSVDGGESILKLLRQIERIHLYVTPESLMEYYTVFDDDATALLPENRHATIHKICRYIRSEAKSYEIHEGCRYWSAPISAEERRVYNTARDWLDYIGWCKTLNYDLGNRSTYLPKNFRAVHDRTMGEYRALLDKRKAEERREVNEAVKTMMKEMRGNIDTGLIKTKELLLVVPEDGEAIRIEGELLHDCLATYVERVARGETYIFFIRRTAEPEVPYFAMEYRDGRLIQCRGKHNCGAPSNVQAFAEAAVKMLNEKVRVNA